MIDQRVLREIVTEVEKLPDDKAVEVLDFVRFLRSRPEQIYSNRSSKRVFDEAKATELYAEAANEDRQLAESGISDYASSLNSEDADAKG
ncbi:MAG: hypothetical protein HY782_18640 [Chloroflexi bacterium]|nr:hypothetical protein [Chloroflexota bacterium]